jgi:hypothetical protein
MAVGDIISVARYNQMQARAAKVLGTGSGTFGYGQTVASSSLPTNVNNNPTVVNATHMQNLKTDLQKSYVHQNNSFATMTDIASQDDITDAVYVEYETASVDIETNALSYNINQMTAPESKLAVTRTTQWGHPTVSTIIHEWTVSFDNNDHLRAFFNSGGEVRTRASLSGGSGAKYTSWIGMITTVGVVKFAYTDTTADSGTDYNRGVYDLTAGDDYVNIWYYEPGAGTYENNNITYQAKLNSAGNQLSFKVIYRDGDPLDPGDGTTGIDEAVSGTFRSIVEQQRATGSYVEVDSPAYANTQTLGE